MKAEDLDSLETAVGYLESPSLGIQVADYFGKPIERLAGHTPESIQDVVEKCLHKALKIAISTMENKPGSAAWTKSHKALATFSGIMGGLLGLAGLPIELPFSTTIMLRSIADLARAEGESLLDPETQMACLEVFALGGNTAEDDAADAGYWVTRTAMAKVIANVANVAGKIGLEKSFQQALQKMISVIAVRYAVVISEKAVAMAVPGIGGAGGGAINLMYTSHYQNMAFGHFTVRRLEREYNPEIVKSEYRKIIGTQKLIESS